MESSSSRPRQRRARLGGAPAGAQAQQLLLPGELRGEGQRTTGSQVFLASGAPPVVGARFLLAIPLADHWWGCRFSSGCAVGEMLRYAAAGGQAGGRRGLRGMARAPYVA